MFAAVRLLDVWIVDLNKVYTGVPFTVVTDWLQEGRLLATDRVRMAGKQKWHPVEAVPALTPYVPRVQPLTADDRAEAEEPIELGLESAKVQEAEDDDVDMIPLIDVSLVLLIFFMMTTAISSGVFSPIATPAAKHQLASISADMLWIGIDNKIDASAKEKVAWFSLGKDKEKTQYLVDPTLDGEAVLKELASLLKSQEGEVKVRLRADKSLPIEAIKGVTLDLQELETRLNRGRDAKARVQIVVLGEVSELTK
jgi:biopolymer transport protein ExbD